MRGGELDRRVSLYHRVLTQDAQGQQIESWPTAYATVFAQKVELTGREFTAAQTTNAEIVTRFRMRWRDDVRVTDRLMLGALSYNITRIAEINRREGIEVVAQAVAS
jgi:SPP1 family predicted phage head-tail adaptor